MTRLPDLLNGEPAKYCTKCGILKKLADFHKQNIGRLGRTARCKDCNYKDQESYRTSIYRRKNYLKNTYGISVEEYNEMYLNQSGKCKICEKFLEKLDIDHCSENNYIRGLLCDDCNLGIGKFNHDIEILKNAIRYLEDFESFIKSLGC